MRDITYLSILLYLIQLTKSDKVIDLTFSFDNTSVYWPTMRQYSFKLEDAGSVDTPSLYYESNRFCAAEHGGTHLDAPRHFAKGTYGVHEIPLEKLIGRTFIIDVVSEANANPDLQVDVHHLVKAEEKLGKIPDDSILLIYTGYSSRYPDTSTYFGSSSTNTSLLHFPGLHPKAAQWLVDNRKIKSIGIDTASVDYGQSTTYQSHIILYSQNIPGFENVNLMPLDPYKTRKDIMIYALPMKIKDGSGAPLRIIAVVGEESSSSASFIHSPSQILFMIVLAVLLLLSC